MNILRKEGLTMKISTKGVYAIEAMTDLARYSTQEVESLKNIAERRQLSEKYLEQIIRALKKKDLVVSIRGAGGGYQLSKSPKDITVLQILDAVEKSLMPIECLSGEMDCGNKMKSCAPRVFWGKLWSVIEDVAGQISLQDILDESDRYDREESIEYYI